MRQSHINFENFDTAEADKPAPSADYLRGFEAGLADALTSNEAARKDALISISTCLQDMQFGYSEARIKLLNELRPLIAQLVDVVLPEITSASFTAYLRDVLTSSFQSVTDSPVEIAVAPDALLDLEGSKLSEIRPFTLIADPHLKVGQARLKDNQDHTMIDVPALLAALQAALQGLEFNERISGNG